MKRLFLLFFCLAGLFASVPISAAPAPPGRELHQMLQVIVKGTKVWKIGAVDSLSKTVPYSFAEHGWRVVLERPFETAPVEGMPDPLGKRKLKNNAELIFIQKLPGVDPKKVRPLLRWKVAPNELYTTIHYLGEVAGLLCFAKADIVTLDWLCTHLRMSGGDNLAEPIANALNEEDENSFSKKSALVLIKKYGDSALPHLKRSMGKALIDSESILPHLDAIKSIGTKEASLLILSAAKSGNPEVLASVLDALSTPPFLADLKELYLMMASQQYNIVAPIEAAIQFGWTKEMLPHLLCAMRTPKSFHEYMVIVVTIDQFRRNVKDSPELGYMEQIKLLLTRSGDLQGTPRIISLSEKASAHQLKMQKEDLARVRPFEDAIVKSANPDMAIVAALLLYTFDPGRDAPVSKDYVRRVQQSGFRILRRLDREKVLRTLETLKRNVESSDESNLFSSLAARLS